MFKAVDLSKKMGKEEYKRVMPDLKLRLGELQRQAHEAGLPAIIVFEGWDAASMVSTINQFLLPLDPRGFSYYNIGKPDRVEALMPFMWQFWMRTPWKGRMAIFDRSWYSRAVAECLGGGKCKALPQDMVVEINNFEKLLTDSGAVMIKLFLHTSNGEDGRPGRKVSEQDACGLIHDDLDLVRHFRKHFPLLEELIEKTDHPYAPWTIVETDDAEFAEVRVMRIVVDRLSRALTAPPLPNEDGLGAVTGRSVRASMDLNVRVSDDEYKSKLEKYQGKLRGVQCELFREEEAAGSGIRRPGRFWEGGQHQPAYSDA